MTKIKIEIKNRFTGNVLFQYEKENNTIKDTVEAAIKSKADLSKADLSKADLSGANLSWADLSKADLSKANLSGANLSEADLYGANLYGADLSWADLSKANLSVANLSWADLSWADLSKANLSGANLSKADLSKANLSEADLSLIKNDMFAVLLNAIPEVPNFRKALVEGKIDGSTYTGECACLCGTLMKSGNKELVTRVDNVKDSGRPIERWFLGIWRGDTPESNPMAKLALGWTDEFLSLIGKII